MSQFSRKPLSIVLGAAVALTGVTAQASVFQAADLGTGYTLVASAEAKTGESKCGAGKGMNGKKMNASEMFEKMDTNSDGTLTMEEFEKNFKAVTEGKCGEGKCGEKKK